MWSDIETEIDFLNYSETADLVSSILEQENIRPVSLGLFGGWGVGKSSLMRMIINDIKEDEKNIVLNFDAWLFQDYDDARASLLQKIGDVLYEKAKKEDKIVEKVELLYSRIDKLRVLGLLAEGTAFAAGIPTFGFITRGLSGVRDLASGEGDKEDYDDASNMVADVKARTKGLIGPEENNSPPKQIEAFRSELKEILNELDCTLFVFIDNLDRCLPEKAIHTLEAVRLFLFMERTAFVIAADEDMIRLAVSQHYKADLDRLVTDYLDKLVQIPVRVPQIGVPELRAFIILLLTTQPANSEPRLRDEVAESLKTFLVQRLQSIWEKPFPEKNEILDALKSPEPNNAERLSIERGTQLARFIAPILIRSRRVNGNPRIVKRMLNTLRMRQIIAERRGISLSEEAMLKLVLFERCAGNKATSDLMNLVGKSSDGKVPLLAELEEGDKSPDEIDLPESWQKEKEFILEWSRLEPTLGDKNLRPAAYLSRETQSIYTPSGSLSVKTERALAVLIKATRESAQSTRNATTAIEQDEALLAMEELIRKLSEAASWKVKPEGWSGAVALASRSDEAANALSTFLKSRELNPPPRWMATSLKNKSWWED